MRTIAIVNQKGGCGKTITAINLSAFLAREPRRVLVVDMDPQGHATLGLMGPTELQKTIYDVLVHDRAGTTLGDIIVKVRENLDLAPADIVLAALPDQLTAVTGKENRLAEALEEVRQNYDYVIVDCGPSVGLLTFNALKACSEAIIPVEPSFFSLHGIAKQMDTLSLLAKKTNHDISARALITMYTGRSEFVKTVTSELRQHLGAHTFDTVIRFSVKLSEAAGHCLPVAEFSTRSAGFADYRALAQEVLARELQPPQRLNGHAKETPKDVPAAPVTRTHVPIELQLAHRMVASHPQRTKDGVLFTIEAPDAVCVQLAADFNDWSTDGNEMQLVGGVWRKLVPLPPGRYHYRYVVDGGWMTDPLNVNIEPTPWGGYNSVFTLDGSNLHAET